MANKAASDTDLMFQFFLPNGEPQAVFFIISVNAV